VERHVREEDAARLDGREQLRREVQAGGGGGGDE